MKTGFVKFCKFYANSMFFALTIALVILLFAGAFHIGAREASGAGLHHAPLANSLVIPVGGFGIDLAVVAALGGAILACAAVYCLLKKKQ